MNTDTPATKRMIKIHDTVADTIEVLDDGTTVADIIHALGWVKKERARSRAKAQNRYVPTGNRPGRPAGWKKGVDFSRGLASDENEDSKN